MVESNSNRPNENGIDNTMEEGGIDFQKLIRNIIGYWWVYLIFIFLFGVLAFLHLRYSTPVYTINAKILVKDTKKGGEIAGSEVFSELDLLGNHNSTENEVELLKSRTLMEKTLEDLQLNVKYFIKGKIKTSEVYHRKLPIILNAVNILEDSLNDTEFIITKVENSFVNIKYQNDEKIYRLNDTVNLPFAKFVIKPGVQYSDKTYLPLNIRLSKKDNAVADLRQLLTVNPTNKIVSTIDLSISDQLPERGEEILNRLLFIYEQMNKDDKNRIADSTMAFIDDRLKVVINELNVVEKEMQGFRQINELTDISSQGKILLDNNSEYLKNLIDQEVQIEVLNSLEDYLKKESNSSRLVPTTLTILDPTLVGLVQDYNKAQLERDKQLQTTAENNPSMQTSKIVIANLKNDILTNLANIKIGMLINRNQLKSKTDLIEQQMRQIPGKERTFLEFSRQQSIKQELYLYLLKKREETAVSKSANVDIARIVDSAKSESRPFSPQKGRIYIGAFILGIVVPGVGLYLRKVLNTRISNRNEIDLRTSISVLAEISHSKDEEVLVVKEGTRTIVAEQFRALRTNLQFVIPGPQEKCILITSSMSGEGKSFVAINLANVLALSGKKIVLLELDLRKPNISKALGLNNKIGLSTFAISRATLQDVLIHSDWNENLYIIPSGPLPPNPSELIMLPRFLELFEKLREEFDYIIIDSAPVGLVTDAQLLSIHANATLFIVRQGFTYKAQIQNLNELYKHHKLPKLSIVLNDVKVAKGYGYGYGYGAYENGYFVNSEKKKNRRKKTKT